MNIVDELLKNISKRAVYNLESLIIQGLKSHGVDDYDNIDESRLKVYRHPGDIDIYHIDGNPFLETHPMDYVFKNTSIDMNMSYRFIRKTE